MINPCGSSFSGPYYEVIFFFFFLNIFLGDFFSFVQYIIQHCFICRPSDSTVPTDAGIEPRTVATVALAVRRSNHQARSHPPLGQISSALGQISSAHQARSHPQYMILYYIIILYMILYFYIFIKHYIRSFYFFQKTIYATRWS